MGRQIPTDRPLSDEDRAFLELWSRREEIADIDAAFPPGSSPASDDDDGVDVDADISEYVESLKVVELREALKANGIEFDSDAKRDELAAFLAIGLQVKRDSGDTPGPSSTTSNLTALLRAARATCRRMQPARRSDCTHSL
jgi:hypothetical protein